MMNRRQTAAARRDHRAGKDAPDVQRSPASRGKNTRRWCGGKPGREHAPKCVPYAEAKRRDRPSEWALTWRILLCTTCGKELAYWMPVSWGRPATPPDWVTSPP